MNLKSCFTPFKGSIKHITLPEKFPFPFYYEPDELASLAAKELQDRMLDEINWQHDFGLAKPISDKALGKMFGVLVVKNKKGEVGYLSAYSGKINGSVTDSIFVPPIFDRFNGQDYFQVESNKLDQLSKEINKLEMDPHLSKARESLEQQKEECRIKLSEEKANAKRNSKARKLERENAKSTLDEQAYKVLYEQHLQLNINDNFKYKSYKEYLDEKLLRVESEFRKLNDKIESLKRQRKLKAKDLQTWLFAQYDFLNKDGESKNVVQIFESRVPNVPPSGAGDCAAPKLIQYAHQNGFELLSMAEFWWGAAPKDEVRKHKYFYPACRGKCGPILSFMLEGIDVASNPMLSNPAIGKKLETVFEDEHLVVINKPAEFLSVPGKHITDSVQERMLEKYPNVTSPMIVHRLDMSTSGLMILAKSKTAHKALQEQFSKRMITKRYVALLDGVLEDDEGLIDLPLRTDYDNRPFQLVCYDHGKPSRTRWQVIERSHATTKVYFYPLSGRTHQLRVHAAHQDGLGTPIVGDDLYGKNQDRLHLHAESIAFEHPITKKSVELQLAAEF